MFLNSEGDEGFNPRGSNLRSPLTYPFFTLAIPRPAAVVSSGDWKEKKNRCAQ